ncbi:hypothetical protein PRK78_005055 [Emydomyces testavorans]|uniref:Protein kinase domain-containing protein n=1 Tax=Emydomyces testavorans TaxID=2070801 RepID=A0AAF0DIZ2_9EURO|nr:hypothetical protein PRK78_005055 [Emydomyces testavorans]
MVNVIGKNWMGNQFDNSSFKFENGSVWKVRGKICEKALLYLYREIEIPGQPAEAQGVYHCQQTEGDDVGKEAIMKIRMQLPPDPRIASPDPKERAKFAQRNPGINSVQEVTSLERLTAANCPFAPKLFAWQVCFQSSEQWVPGGYIMVIVMEKVPGISLERFWARPFPEREKIRLSFRRSLTMLYDLRIDHYDPQPENLIYDANEDRW